MNFPFLSVLICSPSNKLSKIVFSVVLVPVNITFILVSIIYILPTPLIYSNILSPSALSVTV